MTVIVSTHSTVLSVASMQGNVGYILFRDSSENYCHTHPCILSSQMEVGRAATTYFNALALATRMLESLFVAATRQPLFGP